MKHKNFLLLLLLVFALSCFTVNVLFAQESDVKSMLNAPSSSAVKSDDSAQADSSVPEWVKRVDYGINIETDRKPRIYLETVQPLYQDMDKINTFFTHGRVSIESERGTYSEGLGYRRLVLNESLLLGVNSFFDYQDLHRHYRTGAGFEAITKKLEFRTNSYFALSPKRLVEETSDTKTYEKAVNGGDLELGCPLPYLPWIKLYGGYYHYDFRQFKDMNGWKLRGEFRPFKFVTINLSTYDDNKGDQEYQMDTRFRFAFDDFNLKSALSSLSPQTEAFPETDLKEHTLDRVERDFNIKVEKWAINGGTVEIRRGN